MEQILKSIYRTWENRIQGIRNNNDIEWFQRIFNITQNTFYTQYNKKEQCLIAYKAQNYKELTENYERLNYLQNQNFESNMTKQLALKEQTQKLDFIRKRASNVIKAEIKLKTVYNEFCQKADETFDRLQNIFINLPEQQQNQDQQIGLTPRRIRRFQLFTADESHVGDQCSICMEDVEVGRRMRRLNCDGQHYFCKQCIEGWFAEHNTCPLCRHVFV